MNNNAIKYGFYSVLGFAAVVVFAISNGNVPKLPFLDGDDAQIEETAESVAPKDAAPGAESETAEGKAPAAKVAAPAVEEPAPRFDLLRVEKDGSVLVAGNALPNSKISLIGEDGEVLAEDTADDTGAFVVVPDNPLPPGSYALSLRAVDPDGRELVSRAKGILNIPEPGNSDTLAMVSEDGQASEVFVKPDSATPSVNETPRKADSQTGPAQETVAKPDAEVTTTKEPETEAAGTEAPTNDGSETAESETDVSESAESEAAEPETTEPKTAESEADLSEIAAADSEAAKSDEPVSGSETPTEPAEARAEPDPGTSDSSNTAGEATSGDRVLVEAVEVDGGQIFVAGAVESGKRVRVYLDNKVLGDATGTADNRFLLQRDFVLSNGSHLVRADVVDPLSGKVTGRAEVPLIHEVQVAKVEPAPVPKAEPEPKAIPEPETKPEQTTEEAGTAVEDLKDEAESQPETEVKTESDSETPVVEAEPEQPVAPAGTEDEVAAVDVTPAGEETDPEATAPEATAPAAEAAPESTAEVASPKAAEPVGTSLTKEPQNTEPDEAEATVVAKVDKDAETAAPPAVIRTGTSIIIRPGDNLWTISRYTYGRGIHFMTIYHANEDQIRDPDLIYVGQIFKIPDEVEERSEN